ncbi:MAG: hypothetical protein Q8Q24_00480 [bacterium]|nr:hypothetical protein [bacterium]
MSGAIKPPWITKPDFYRTPFNYCDRWCEKCHLTEICRVFQDTEKSRQKFIKEGKDPDSLECVFETIKESFEQTAKLLKQDAKRLGIDVSKINLEEEKEKAPADFPLYKLIIKFSKKLEGLLSELRFVPMEADPVLVIENTEIVSYYHLMLPAKIYRSCLSKTEEDAGEEDWYKDSKTSAFIALNALLQITEALSNLAYHKPLVEFHKKIASLAQISINLAKVVSLEFDLESKPSE